ncbi:hypothetical protein BGW39_009686 [Mortierella sp. 14UC]|nr:hypothetical protein BGW39_009686 [Mortierella sp. 14UC]
MAAATTGKPKVVIVGAGLGGVMLATLLEKCHVPYLVVERAAVVKPLGSAITIGSTILPVFEQLHIADELCAIGTPWTHYNTFDESKQLILSADFSAAVGLTRYRQYILARPALYDLLLKQIPPEKVHFAKRVTTIIDDGDKVQVETADGSLFKGDILVGADGAYSTVRQQLYERLFKEGKLPESDQEELPFSCICLVGQTTPLNHEEFPIFKEPLGQLMATLGNDNAYSYLLFTTAPSTISWMTMHHLDKVANKSTYNSQRDHTSSNLQWGPNAAKAMCDETREFPLPIGDGTLTMGDMYDRTPQDLISKVSLEEKVFETWYSGRTVLLGDACYKMHPSGGRGALSLRD